jgi:hypothetical protein
MREERGWLFPEGLEIPDQHWYQIDFGGDVMHDLDREGHLFLAEQCGLESMQTDIAAHGSDDGVLYACATAEARFDDGDVWKAVGGADAASQQVRDPEHTFSVAATRAIKRVVKNALGIRSAESPDVETPDEGRSVPSNAPDDVDAPPSEWDGPESSDAPQSGDMGW